ncbi:MAG: tRNA (adenosine(37)-N6)-threonylcarbamoyltransferase complex transferase subunit TsaD [Neisseriaceae bacterium]|nr:MAG: tRNA (adenosine(37)-N6)-threonylcarbamoyltransferase complex transferase subunit TsaD [Neisseriaceae bacterium]
MIVLGLESSCDETGVALYDSDKKQLLAHGLHSQIAMHAEYGGVVPELASRDHINRIAELTEKCVSDATISWKDIDAIAYTQGPGLGGALLVATGFAHGLALSLDRPLIPVHHLEGHLLSPLLSENKPEFPFIALLVSGGHTQLFKVTGIGEYELLGESVDDAVGEAFDKTAKLLGLPYPGGAQLSRLANLGDEEAYLFPRPMLYSKDLNMSFSGLKTAVLTKVTTLTRNNKVTLSEKQIYDIAASFQAAVVEVLHKKVELALEVTGLNLLVVAGGVGANQALRQALKKLKSKVYFPELQWCTDNGAMIALAGAMRLDIRKKAQSFTVKSRWSLTDINN